MNTAFETLHERLQRQTSSLSNMQSITDQMSSMLSMRAMVDEIERHSPARAIREQVEKLGLGFGVFDSLNLSASAEWSKRVTELTSGTAHLNSLGLDIAGLQSITNKVNIGSSTLSAIAGWNQMDRISGLTGLTKMPEHLQLAQQLQHQVLGGLSLHEFANRLTPSIPTFSAIEAARESLGSLMSGFRDIDWDAIQEPDDAFQEEAVAQIGSISGEAARQLDLQGAVDQIVAAIAAQHKPEVRFALTVFFSRLFWCILGALIQAGVSAALASYVAPNDVSQSPQETAKQIKEAAQAAVPTPDLLTGIRYISATEIIVRLNPRAQSPRLGKLKFGNVVQILKKEKDFTLIAWKDNESDAEIQGWVFSRYLKKFN